MTTETAPFLACQERLLPGETLQRKWEFATAAGYDAVELSGGGGFALRDRLPELRRARRDGVVMTTVRADTAHFFGAFDPDLRRDAIEQTKSQLSVIAEIGGTGVRTPASRGMFSRCLPPFEPPRDAEEDREVLLSGLAEMGEHAEREGALLFLEPLNRYEDHMVNRIDQAADLVRASGNEAVRIGVDSYHMNIEEADPAAAVVGAGTLIGHVRVSDSNRLQPGAGHIDWPLLLGALDAVGYEGQLTVECRLDGDPAAALESVPVLLRRAAA